MSTADLTPISPAQDATAIVKKEVTPRSWTTIRALGIPGISAARSGPSASTRPPMAAGESSAS